MIKQILLFSIFFIPLSCGNKSNEESTLIVDLSSKIVIPKHYVISKSKEQIVIDRIANESSWQFVLFTDSFIDIEGIKTPKYDTKVKMLWDDNYLYVYSQMEEPYIWGNLKQRDTVIYYNNDFEVFIDPSGTTTNYAEIYRENINWIGFATQQGVSDVDFPIHS